MNYQFRWGCACACNKDISVAMDTLTNRINSHVYIGIDKDGWNMASVYLTRDGARHLVDYITKALKETEEVEYDTVIHVNRHIGEDEPIIKVCAEAVTIPITPRKEL